MSKTASTRDRLLSAACRIFAENGFRNTTIADICEAADANIAAVNYHFGDKESLYDAVWRHAAAIAKKIHPIDGNLPKQPELYDVVYSFARAVLGRMFSDEDDGLFAKLLHQEMSNPTLALVKI